MDSAEGVMYGDCVGDELAMDLTHVIAQIFYLPSHLVIEADFPTSPAVEGPSMLRVLDRGWLRKQIASGDYVSHVRNERVAFLMRDAQIEQGIAPTPGVPRE